MTPEEEEIAFWRERALAAEETLQEERDRYAEETGDLRIALMKAEAERASNRAAAHRFLESLDADMTRALDSMDFYSTWGKTDDQVETELSARFIERTKYIKMGLDFEKVLKHIYDNNITETAWEHLLVAMKLAGGDETNEF